MNEHRDKEITGRTFLGYALAAIAALILFALGLSGCAWIRVLHYPTNRPYEVFHRPPINLDNRKPGAESQDFGENPWFALSEPFAVCVVNPLAVTVVVETLTQLGEPTSKVSLTIPPHKERCYLTQMEQQDLIEPPSLIVEWHQRTP